MNAEHKVFRIAVRLREDDDESRGICSVLAHLCGDGLWGGGGYRRGRPTGNADEDVVLLIMQRNADDGALRTCTEEDRERSIRALSKHPNVARFAVGPIEEDGGTQEEFERGEAAILRQLREQT